MSLSEFQFFHKEKHDGREKDQHEKGACSEDEEYHEGSARKEGAITNGKPKKMSAIDAADQGLADAKQPMNCKELIEAMSAKGLWTSPGGKTPNQTLYSAIAREIKEKGKEARFTKTERGKFAAN